MSWSLHGALKIETGSIVAGKTGTKAWLEVMPSGQLIADSVTFTSEEDVITSYSIHYTKLYEVQIPALIAAMILVVPAVSRDYQ